MIAASDDPDVTRSEVQQALEALLAVSVPTTTTRDRA